jgi:hypothetical protein
MSLNERIKAVERLVGPLRRRREGLSCKGLDFAEILTRVEAAIDPADEDIVERILAHYNAAAATPWKNQTTGEPYLDDDGVQLNEMHFFGEWLSGLQQGWFSLPARLPRGLLETFDRRYGCLLWRCEDCRAGHGNAVVRSACCVCGGKLLQRSLCGESLGWETVEEYTARIQTRKTEKPCPPTAGTNEPKPPATRSPGATPPSAEPSAASPPANAGPSPNGDSPLAVNRPSP